MSMNTLCGLAMKREKLVKYSKSGGSFVYSCSIQIGSHADIVQT